MDWIAPGGFNFDRALDFVALPLFVYGLVALLVAQRRLISGLLSSVTYFVGGKLRSLSLKHMSLKPHRISSFLLIVGLMASVSLYPSIASKVIRGQGVARRHGAGGERIAYRD